LHILSILRFILSKRFVFLMGERLFALDLITPENWGNFCAWCLDITGSDAKMAAMRTTLRHPVLKVHLPSNPREKKLESLFSEGR